MNPQPIPERSDSCYCLDNTRQPNDVVLTCGHWLHFDCLVNWLLGPSSVRPCFLCATTVALPKLTLRDCIAVGYRTGYQDPIATFTKVFQKSLTLATFIGAPVITTSSVVSTIAVAAHLLSPNPKAFAEAMTVVAASLAPVCITVLAGVYVCHENDEMRTALIRFANVLSIGCIATTLVTFCLLGAEEHKAALVTFDGLAFVSSTFAATLWFAGSRQRIADWLAHRCSQTTLSQPIAAALQATHHAIQFHYYRQ